MRSIKHSFYHPNDKKLSKEEDLEKIVSFAKEKDYTFSTEDLKSFSKSKEYGELTEGELDAVAGGSDHEPGTGMNSINIL